MKLCINFLIVSFSFQTNYHHLYNQLPQLHHNTTSSPTPTLNAPTKSYFTGKKPKAHYNDHHLPNIWLLGQGVRRLDGNWPISSLDWPWRPFSTWGHRTSGVKCVHASSYCLVQFLTVLEHYLVWNLVTYLIWTLWPFYFLENNCKMWIEIITHDL